MPIPHPLSGLVLGALAVLPGCATWDSYAQLDGRPYHRAYINRYPVRIAAIDGEHSLRDNPIMVRPGEHRVLLAAPPARGFQNPVEKEFTLRVEPCRRYYVVAQRESPLVQDWDLVIDHDESIAGCRPGGAAGGARLSG